jgi:tetratricopeptide (TPR) repeat protein
MANLNKIQLGELHQQAIKHMDSGDYKASLDTARKIQNLGSHYFVSYIASGLLIDIGVGLNDQKIIMEGVELLQKDLRKITRSEKYASTANYNLANGFYALFAFRKNKDHFALCFKESEIDKAKFYFRESLKHNIQNPTFKSKIYVNLGNCYDELGRVVEALECFDEALKWNPDHGMALGNKGQALLNYAALSGEHQGTLIIEAYGLLSKALKLGVTPEAEKVFAQYQKHIRDHFPDKQTLEEPPKYPGYKIKTKSKIEKFLIEFCLEHKLYLNVCNFCQKCAAAIGDTIVIKRMLVRKPKNIKKDTFLQLSSYLNHIKQDFITARFLLIISRFKGINLDFVDNNVTIVDTLDQTRHNIYIQLLKEAFKSFYNILDKIACFIDNYLELGIPKNRINFNGLWYSDQKAKTIRNKIAATKNFGLNALFDIHRDFEKGPYKKLRKTRNALTHRFINIKTSPKPENYENMTEESLLGRTLELSRIVRSAIIYLLCFVSVEETKKEKKTTSFTKSLKAREIPKSLRKREL